MENGKPNKQALESQIREHLLSPCIQCEATCPVLKKLRRRLRELETSEEREQIRGVFRQFYQGSGYDVWGESTPEVDEFLDVLRDRCAGELSGALGAHWFSLSRDEQDALILTVGP
jgi:hypothetical protein